MKEVVKDISDKIIEDINTFSQVKLARKVTPCRIKLGDKFVITKSGKTIWRRIGDAKTALRVECNDRFNESAKAIYQYKMDGRLEYSINGKVVTSDDFYEIKEKAIKSVLAKAEYVTASTEDFVNAGRKQREV